MSIEHRRFTLYAPGNERVLLGLERFIGVRTLLKDWDGRRYFTMPEPFSDVRIYDGETLTAAKCGRLAAAVAYFATDVSSADLEALDFLKKRALT